MKLIPLALLASAALASAGPALAQTASTPKAASRAASQEEIYCVYDALDEPALIRLANLGTLERGDALEDMLGVAEDALDGCAAKWRWGNSGRGAGLHFAASMAGVEYFAALLKDRIPRQRLDKLHQMMSQEDRFALTVSGGAEDSSPDRAARIERFRALLTREGVKAQDFDLVASFFIAYARGVEAQDFWTILGREGRR